MTRPSSASGCPCTTPAPHGATEEFDASWNRGDIFDFRLGAREVIEGWDKGVAGMRVGGRRRLTIPPHLGYGSRGAGE